MNIYGGKVYENSGFVFDKIYENYASLDVNDGVYPLRYVLIKYCDTAFTSSDISDIINKKFTSGDEKLSEDAEAWLENYETDEGTSYDRKVFRKEVKADGSLEYKEFATLNTSVYLNGFQETNLNLTNGDNQGLQSRTDYNSSYAPGNYAVALGLANKAYGDFSFAIGGAAQAGKDGGSGTSAIALGNSVKALEKYSFASGLSSLANGIASTATGWKTSAEGQGSFSAGLFTSAAKEGQFVVGKRNKESEALFVVGNGNSFVSSSSEEVKSNAFEVFADGHAEVQSSHENDNSVIRKIDLVNYMSDFMEVYSETDSENVVIGDNSLTLKNGHTPQIVVIY